MRLFLRYSSVPTSGVKNTAFSDNKKLKCGLVLRMLRFEVHIEVPAYICVGCSLVSTMSVEIGILYTWIGVLGG